MVDYADLLTEILDNGFNRTIRPLTQAITGDMSSNGRVGRLLNVLEDEAARAERDGRQLTLQDGAVGELLAELQMAGGRYAGQLNALGPSLQALGVDASGRWTYETMTPNAGDLARLGISFNRPDPRAILELIDITQSEAWSREMRGFANIFDPTQINGILLRGIATGTSPLTTARMIRDTVTGLPLYRANTIARTTQLNAYRKANSVHQLANKDIFDYQIRIETLDSRVCMSCLALHGTRMPLGEVVIEHPNGRGTSIVVVKGFKPPEIESGDDWLKRLGNGYKNGTLTPGDRTIFEDMLGANGRAVRAILGGKTQLNQYVHYQDHPFFGLMPLPMSTKRVLEGYTGNTEARSLYGYLRTPTGVPGTTLDSLRTYLLTNGEDTPLSRWFWDDSMGLVGYDEKFNLIIQKENVRNAAKAFVVESRDFRYSRDYLIDGMRLLADSNGVTLSMAEAEALYNREYSLRAEAIRLAAQIGNVPLTEPQARRLQEAINGGYLDMVYDENRKVGGSLQSAIDRTAGTYFRDARSKALREEFLNAVVRDDRRR